MKRARLPHEDSDTGRHFEMDYEATDDPYQLRGKLPEPTACSDCGAVYQEGNWHWMAAPPDAHKVRCPACRRIHEDMPAGYVSIEGQFAHDHRDDIVNLIRNLETREKAEHPMQRIMAMHTENGALSITTTDIHLARNIGEGLRHAYKGELNFHYNKSEYILRVHWRRGAANQPVS